MKFNLHRTEYPFEVVPNVTIDAEDEVAALAIAKEYHSCKDNPNPAVSRVLDVWDDNGHAHHH